MPHPLRLALACVLIAGSLAPASAQEEGWGTGFHMGTAWAGASNAQKGRITFFCGEAKAARANKAIAGGPYLQITMPAGTAASTTTAEIVLDGKPTAIPVTAKAEGDGVEIEWKPSAAFDAKRMRGMVAALRKAKTIEVRAGGQAATFPSKGADKALAEDPLGC